MTELVTLQHGDKALADIDLGKKILGWLETYYPSHAFYVTANHEAGWATIQLLYRDISGVAKLWKYGMGISIPKSLLTENDIKRTCFKFGGELLERYGLARSAAKRETRLRMMEQKIDTGNMIK